MERFQMLMLEDNNADITREVRGAKELITACKRGGAEYLEHMGLIIRLSRDPVIKMILRREDGA